MMGARMILQRHSVTEYRTNWSKINYLKWDTSRPGKNVLLLHSCSDGATHTSIFCSTDAFCSTRATKLCCSSNFTQNEWSLQIFRGVCMLTDCLLCFTDGVCTVPEKLIATFSFFP